MIAVGLQRAIEAGGRLRRGAILEGDGRVVGHRSRRAPASLHRAAQALAGVVQLAGGALGAAERIVKLPVADVLIHQRPQIILGIDGAPSADQRQRVRLVPLGSAHVLRLGAREGLVGLGGPPLEAVVHHALLDRGVGGDGVRVRRLQLERFLQRRLGLKPAAGRVLAQRSLRAADAAPLRRGDARDQLLHLRFDPHLVRVEREQPPADEDGRAHLDGGRSQLGAPGSGARGDIARHAG